MSQPDISAVADELLQRRESLGEQGVSLTLDELCRDATAEVRREVERRLADILAAEQALDDSWTLTSACDDESLPRSFVPRGIAGRYVDPRVCVEGGMGILCTADDVELNRRVAYKVMRPDRRDLPGALGRFFNEARVTAGLAHPGIVPVFGRGVDDSGLPAYASEFVPGHTLAHAIDQLRQHAPADRTRLVRSFVAVCQIVAYAHSKRVVHGDIKPRNIMIDEFGATRLIDWGVARVLDEEPESPLDGATPREGTPWFISTPHTAATFASDVYALGLTLALILTEGKPRRQDELRPAAGTPPALWAVACKAMNLDRTRRYPTAEALARDVQDVLDDLPVSAYRDSPLTALRRLAKRHRVLAGSVALLVLAVAIVGPFWIARERQLRNRADAERAHVIKLTSSLIDQTDLIGKFQASLPASRALLDQAVAQIEELAREGETTGTEPGMVAAHYDRAGRINLQLNQLAEAVRCFERAATLAERRFAARPDDLDNRNLWANSLREWGVALAQMGQAREAESVLNRARALVEPATDGLPATRWCLSRVLFALGNLRMFSGDQAQARALYETARELAESLRAAAPDEVRYLDLLARIGNNEGRSFQVEAMPRGFQRVDQDKLARSATAHVRALELRRRATRLQPGNPDLLSDVAASLNHLANVALSQGGAHLAEAEPLYREARGILESLAFAYPGVPGNRRELAEVLSNLNVLLTRQKRLDEAAALARSSLDLFHRLVADYPDTPDLHADHGVALEQYAATLRRVGRPTEAQPQLFASAVAFARAHALTREPNQRTSLASKTLALLDSLESSGYFRAPDHAAALRDEPAFALLRDQPKFPSP